MSASDDLPHDPTEVHSFLEKAGLIKTDGRITLVAYEPAFPRRPAYRRWHYRVENEGQPVCHLIVGLKLARVNSQAEQFSRACPTLICRPLAFWERTDGMGFLCLEHFSGESLEDMMRGGRCTAEEWLRVIRQALHLLEASSIASTADALHREIQDLVNGLSAFPEFSSLDMQMVRELAESLLLKQSTFDPLTTRWSNGDFIGRNLLVNAQGDLRLIDYEHAGPTHFWRSDWLRMTQFSQLPPGLDISKIEELSLVQQPWQLVQFWLHNLSQLSEAEPCEPVDRHIGSVTSELFKAVDSATAVEGTSRTPSFLLKILANKKSVQDGFNTTPRDERYRQRRLEEDLEQVNYRVLSLERELAQKTAVIRNWSGTRVRAEAEITTLASECDRLHASLRQSQGHLDRLLSQNSILKQGDFPDLKGIRKDSGTEDLYSIDQKDALFAKKGQLILTGRIKRISSETKVRLRMDPGNIFDCTISEKPLLEPGELSDPAKGQTVDFALKAYVPSGLHLVTLEYYADPSQCWMTLCTRSLVAEISPLLMRLETAISPTTPQGDYLISGWCLHPQEKIKTLSVRHGSVISDITYGIVRSDVAESHSWCLQATNSGFSGSFTTQPGEDDVVLSARLESGFVVQEIIARRVLVPDAALFDATEALSKPSAMNVATFLPYCELGQPLYFGQEDNISPYLEFGWHGPEHGMRWAVGPRAGLRFLFRRDALPSAMIVTVMPLIVAEKAERQRININLPSNTTPETIELTSAQPQELTFHLGATDSSNETLTVRFGFPDAMRPSDLGLSNDNRLLSLAFISIKFT